MSSALPPFVGVAKNGGWKLYVWVQPAAKRTEIAGMHGNFVKIRLQAPAVDNKANNALTGFVAKILGIKAQQVTLESGHGSRQKTLLVYTEEEPDWKVLSGQAYVKP